VKKLIDHLPLTVPWGIAVDPSSKCNFQCQYCPTSNKDVIKNDQRGIMSFGLYKKIVDDIHCMNGKIESLKLWKDGEPFLNPDIIEFIRYAKEKDVAKEVRITTNGSLLHKYAEHIVNAELDWIMISFISNKEAAYKEHANSEKMRNIVINNTERLRIEREKRRLNKPFIAVKMCKYPFITDNDIKEFKTLFQDIADTIIIHDEPMNWDNSHKTDLTLGAKPENLHVKKVCPFAWYQLNINYNGLVSICPVDWSFKTVIGDVNTESLSDIWSGSKMKDFKRMFAYQDLQHNNACKNCNYYYYTSDNIDSYVINSKAYDNV